MNKKNINSYLPLFHYFHFSRDKTHLNEIITEKHVIILLQCANLAEDTLCIIITKENTDGTISNNCIKNLHFIDYRSTLFIIDINYQLQIIFISF